MINKRKYRWNLDKNRDTQEYTICDWNPIATDNNHYAIKLIQLFVAIVSL